MCVEGAAADGKALRSSSPSHQCHYTCARPGVLCAPGKSDRGLRWAFFLVPGTKAPSCVQRGLGSGCGSEQADQGSCCGHVLLWV